MKWIFKVGNKNDYCHLGHEIHCFRSIIFDIISLDLIPIDKIIILTSRDRKFLYSRFFETYDHEEFLIQRGRENLLKKNISVDFNKLVRDPHSGGFSSNFFNNATGNKLNGIYKTHGFNNYQNEKFKKYITTCDAEKNNIFDTDFIAVHYRNMRNNSKSWNNTTDESENFIYDLLESLKEKSKIKNILIFGNFDGDIKIENLNIIKTRDLKLYVSCLMSDFCKILISSWSGGGQLGQFFFNGKILYYHKGDQLMEAIKNFLVTNNYEDRLKNPYHWDDQTFSDCKRYFFWDSNHILAFFKKYSLDELDEIYNKKIKTPDWLNI